MAQDVDDDALREQIAQWLEAGLTTEVFPRADSHEQVQAIVGRLQREGTTLRARVVISGLTSYAVVHQGLEQPCDSCMYYLVHRKYCELPELDFPVEPRWSCRLWRI